MSFLWKGWQTVIALFNYYFHVFKWLIDGISMETGEYKLMLEFFLDAG